MRRPGADREEKRVTYGNGLRREEQLDLNNLNQRSAEWRLIVTLAGREHKVAHQSGWASPYSDSLSLKKRHASKQDCPDVKCECGSSSPTRVEGRVEGCDVSIKARRRNRACPIDPYI